MTPPFSGLVRDAAAPLLVLGALAVAVLADSVVWLAAAAATPHPLPWSPSLLPQVIAHGPTAILGPTASPSVFWTVLVVQVIGLITVPAAATVWHARRNPGPLGRSLLRRHQLGDLAGHAADTKAHHLRPTLTGPSTPDDRGIRLMRLDGHDVYMSWEDVALIIMGPRSNKTSAIAVPAVLSAPGLAIATSNKADLWTLTRGLRAERGPVWTFDPQEIAYTPQQWWWDPLRAIRDAPEAARGEAAGRLAGHFMATIGGTRRDPFFHAAGEQVLTATLLAAALDDTATLREVIDWLQHGRRDAVAALDTVGATTAAADLEAALGGADVTTKGIFQTARTATKALASERILRWVTPPATWSQPGLDLPELDPWQILTHAQHRPATLHLLSKEGAGTAAPVVAAIVDRLLEVAEHAAQAAGGRLEPPLVAVLDEAANICPITNLPQLYSHYGSRGLQVLTMLQSYGQGVGVWGQQGMDTLWSAATIKLVGAGVDDHTFLQRLSGLIGDHDVEQLSTSHGRGQGPTRQYSSTRRPILPPDRLRALPKTDAVLLATGRPAGLGQLQPWYREPDAADIHTYAAQAITELRTAATDALHPTHRTQTRGERR